MTIDSITGRTQASLTVKTPPKAEANNGKDVSIKKYEKNDSVAITAMAQDIKKAFESAASATIVDMDKVSAVKKALTDGNYQINAERIAEKMIQYEKPTPKNSRT